MRRRKQKGIILPISGRWYVRYWEAVPQGGELIRKRKTHCLGSITGRSKKPPADIVDEAEKYMTTVVNDKSIPSAHNMTLAAFVETEFLPRAKLNKRPSTYKSYSPAWKNHLKAVAGRETESVKNIQTYMVQAWMDKIAQKKMARHSLQHIKSALSKIFQEAKRLQYRKDSNPVHEVTLPPTPEPKVTHAYSFEEEQAILSLLEEPAATAFAIACFTGLRIGEITGLNWEDFSGSELRVSRSVWSGQVNEPKTEKSKATVPVIRQLRERLEMHRLRSGNPQSGPMFKNYRGDRMNLPNIVFHSIRPCLDRCAVCGKPKWRSHSKEDHDFVRDERLPVWHGWHAARRGLGSNLYRMGVPDMVIQRILRHSNVATTQSFYIKPNDADAKIAMVTFEQNLDRHLSLEVVQDTQRTLDQPAKLDTGTIN
jgi:integrase